MKRMYPVIAVCFSVAVAFTASLTAQDVGLTPPAEDVRSTIKEPADSPLRRPELPFPGLLG